MFRDFGTQGKKHKINKPLQNHGGGGHRPTYKSVGSHADENDSFSMKGALKNLDKATSGDASRNQGWNALLRVGAFLAAGLGMYISAQFSVDGFKFSVDERSWIGWGMAAILILIQSIWQKFGNNITLFVMAMVCYGYGITTNVLGILSNRGGYDDNPMSLVVPLVFGILLEVFPEPVMAWSISGDISSDPLKKLLDRFESKPSGSKRYAYDVDDELKKRIGR